MFGRVASSLEVPLDDLIRRIRRFSHWTVGPMCYCPVEFIPTLKSVHCLSFQIADASLSFNSNLFTVFLSVFGIQD